MNKFLTVDQVATLLGVSRKTLMKSVKANEIPHVKIGNQYRFNPRTIEGLGMGGEDAN